MFMECNSLSSVIIGDEIVRIDEYTFYRCNGIVQINVGKNTKYISNGAFSECEKLKDVELPSNIEQISNYAFSGCKELENVYCYAESVPTTQTNSFSDSYIEYANLYVPSCSVEKYKQTEVWKDFGTIVGMTDDIEIINDNIKRDNTIYDLSGRRLSESITGVNIINGKKVFVK